MGCCYSNLDREEVVTRCKARRRYMKELVKARHAFAAAHTMYLRSLRGTGSALLQFADYETHQLRHRHHPQPSVFNHHLPPPLPSPPAPQTPPRPPPPPPLSPSSDAYTSVTASPCLPPPPPPPPSSWDFWDPFAPSSSRSVTEEEWEATTTSVSEVNVSSGAAVAAPPSVVSAYTKDNTTSELAMVVSRSSKDLTEIVKELDEYFLNAANAGSHVSLLLEAPSSVFSSQRMTGKVHSYGRSLSPLLWSWGNSKPSGVSSFGRLGEEMIRGDLVGGDINTSHCSTVERLYAWEKKLYAEVKNAESIKVEHKKSVALLRRQEAKGADYIKIEKNKKEIEKLESRLIVASQAMETTSDEIIRLREVELYPQLLELAKALMHMWRSMYECHQVQTHIVQQLKFLNNLDLGTEPTSEIHRQATLQLELEVQQWHSAFCSIIKSQRDYVHSLTGWLRLCLFQFNHHPLTKTQQNSAIYSLCEEWHLALDRIPDKVASEGIKSFFTVIHSVVVQQAEEQKLKKRSDALFKELNKRVSELRALENKYGPYSSASSWSGSRLSPVDEKRAKVDALRARAEDEKTKFEKSSSVTRAMTVNNLQTGFPNVFQAMTGFSSVCMQAFESVQNQPMQNPDQIHDVKRLLM